MPIYKDDWMNNLSKVIDSYANISNLAATQQNYRQMTMDSQQKQAFDQQMQLSDIEYKRNQDKINAQIGLMQGMRELEKLRAAKKRAEDAYFEDLQKTMIEAGIDTKDRKQVEAFQTSDKYAAHRAKLRDQKIGMESASEAFTDLDKITKGIRSLIGESSKITNDQALPTPYRWR